MVCHQLFSRLLVVLAVLLVESAVSAQEAKAPPKPPAATQRQQPAQPKAPAKTVDGKAEKAPVVPAISLEEKEQIFQSTLDGVLSSAFQIEPVEYGIIVQIEGAALLWNKDRVRANEVLANAWSRLRELMADKGNSRLPKFGEKLSDADRIRLRQAILRRIAKLNPDLIKDWTSANGDNAKPVFASGEEGGTAIVAIAVEELQRDPEKAMKLAAQGLSYEAWYPASTFLTQLWFKDKQLAEKQALVYLEKLPVGSTANLFLVTKLHFFLSPPLREKYFEALAVRLRAAFRPDLDRAGYLNLLDAVRKGASQATTHPVWRDEYLRLTAEVEAAMANRAVNSAAPPSKTVNMSGMSPATPGDTAEIEHSSEKLEAIRNQKIKDAEYQRLAIEAAEKADVTLAERLLSKISDEIVRRQTSVSVYGPLVGKAMAEKDWPQAKSYALKVTDLFGMSLIVDGVAKAMSSAKQDKQMVANFYDDALANLDREKPSPYVAKGVITIAKSRVSEEQGGFTAPNLAVSVLNKLDVSESFSSKSGLASGIGAWINQSNLVLLAEDYFELTETLVPLFRDLSKRDIQRTQSLASALTHQGLRSLAQLGLAKGIREDLQKAKPAPSKKGEAGTSEQANELKTKEEIQRQKELLLSELSNLDSNVVSLSSPLAKAVVKTEIADAVWGMDKRWTEQLLKEAFDLALPDKETRQKLKEMKKGSNPIEPTREVLAQEQVRRKILAVAQRDAALFEELVKLGKEQIGEAEEVKSHSSSAYEALQSGDKKQAIESINKLFEADPTQVSVGSAIREMAIRDRAEADKLVIGYIQALRNFPISSENVHRVVSSLRSSVFPAPPFDKQGRKIPVAGEEAQRAYYGFLIECLLGLEQREPGTAMKFRQLIVSMWPYVSQQASNLTAEYLKLESVSRIPGRPDTLPTISAEERNRTDYENTTKNLSANNSVSEIVSAIGRALGQQDFETSRRLTELLPQGQLRSEYTEKVNWREAISLLGKKDFDGAAKLASKLTEAPTISEVYPQLIRNCVDKKDTGCVNSFTSELTKKLEKVDPMKAVLILSGIASTIASKDEPMALELLASAASAANTNGVKRAKHEEHVVGFECKAFELLTPTNEARVRQMADTLIDRFQRQMAFAAIYRAKANALAKLEKKPATPEQKAK